MKIILLLLIILLFYGNRAETRQNDGGLAELNLIIQTDMIVDSVWVSDIGQKERFFLPFADTIKVDFKKRLNDLYNINFYTSGGRISDQLWLDGTKLIVKGQLDKKIKINSVQNSDLYKTSVVFYQRYREMIDEKSDSTVIDNFLLRHIKRNIDSPFSFAIANHFINRNQNNKTKIRTLVKLFEHQNEALQNHFISNHDRINNLLKISSLNISHFKFGDIENRITTIKLDYSNYYLLDFWSLTCPPCINDHKTIAKKANFLNEKNIALIGISTDHNYSAWKEYIMENNYNWKNYREIESSNRVTNELAIRTYPTYILLTDSGEIIARFSSFKSLESYLK